MPEQSINVTLREENVMFHNGDVTLSGSLVLPTGEGPHPAVVILHGSGAYTPESGPNLSEFYCDYAEYFAANGIATLIYDKRGAGKSSGRIDQRTFDNLTEDALAGFRFLQSHNKLDATRVGLWGFSQGGWQAPLAASRCGKASFAVSVSGPSVSPMRQELYRVENDLPANGFDEDAVQRALAFMRLKFEVGRTGDGWEKLETEMQGLQDEEWFRYVLPPKSLEGLRRAWKGGWSYDPVPTLEKLAQLGCPYLAVFGEKDTTTPVEPSITRMIQVFAECGYEGYEIKVFPETDHFVKLQNGEYPSDYLPSMTAWMRLQVGLDSPRYDDK